MATGRKRIFVRVTSAEKKRLARKARQAGLSFAEYLRRAAAAFCEEDDDEALAAVLAQVERSTAAAVAAIDDALTHVDASNERIRAMERAAGLKP